MIPIKMELRLREHFAYILDSSHVKFQTIYLHATYLNPILYECLTMPQIKAVHMSLGYQMYKQTYICNDISNEIDYLRNDESACLNEPESEKRNHLIKCITSNYNDITKWNVSS
jgi:hypothetical protein